MGKTSYRWFVFIAGIFISTLIISNIIAVKLVNIFGLYLPAAVILFPLTYIVGDVLTEVYGYARARQVIWIGFFCNLLAVGAIWLAGLLPAAPFWNAGAYGSAAEAQNAYKAILGFAPRLLAASFIAYLAGEFLNSYVLAKLKVSTSGRFLWLRTIGSTIVGQGVDSAIFISAAFWGVFPASSLWMAIVSQWLFKAAYETIATPLTYYVVNKLKRIEGTDYYDTDTNFNPIKVFFN
ncbi:MAG: queuosine precursor transporter [candidate division Zixibacteria bacterium]|nr:queuosine precursor transporter [candidate division Zixibacteria bacterium]